jgi:hypothetical protein
MVTEREREAARAGQVVGQATRTDQRADRPAPTPTPWNPPPEQIATPPTSEPYIDTLLVNVQLGPWRGMVLHLPNADAAQAIADKWAVLNESKNPPVDANAALPPPLTPAETDAAIAAAEAYVAAQQPPADPPTRGTGSDEKRDMTAADRRPGYETRETRRR